MWHEVFTGVGSNFCEFGFRTVVHVALETNFFGTFDPFSRNTGTIRKRLTVVFTLTNKDGNIIIVKQRY